MASKQTLPQQLLQYKWLLIGFVLAVGMIVGLGQLPAQAAPSAPDAGLVYNGLEVNQEVCGMGYLLSDAVFCTHGPDPAFGGYAAQRSVESLGVEGLIRSAAARPFLFCDGDGKNGKRLQVIYARAGDKPDRYAEYVESIRTWAWEADEIFDLSAHITGGHRHLRYVTDADCQIDVWNLVLPPSADDSFKATITALRALGHQDNERKYLLFMDATLYCGIGTIENDSRAGADNLSDTQTGYARIDSGCWSGHAAAHELVHLLGGVQNSAPNASGGWHCVDENDLVCYSDATYQPALKLACKGIDYEELLDCNHDDYYHTNPAPNSYLATHWNVANSAFLMTPQTMRQMPPEIMLVTSVKTTVFTAPATVVLEVHVAENDHTVQRVEFYKGPFLLTTQITGPYQYTWSPVEAGVYLVSAIAYDERGYKTASNTLEISVVDDLTNIVLGRSSMQSSTNSACEARLAVNGQTANPVVCTNQEMQPWWQVDLGEVASIAEIRLRADTTCCATTNELYVLVSSEPFTSATLADARLAPGITTYYVAALTDAVAELPMNAGQRGRYIRIWAPDVTQLALVEVEVLTAVSAPQTRSQVSESATANSAVFLPIIIR
jgi:hypothetical protein